MRNYKKILAAGLAVSMVMGSSVAVLAEDANGELSGSGNLEQLEATDIFNVKLPTIDESTTTFNYILDPNGLIKESGTDGRYTGKTFEEGATLFFQNINNKTDSKDYSKTSDKLTAINESTQDVEISVKATVASVSGVKMDADGTFGTDGGNLYLALTDGTDTEAITENGAELTATIAKTDGVYKVKWDAAKELYVKELDSTKTDADFQKYEFQLTGACKSDTVWDTMKDTPPVVDVVWSVKDFTVTGPQITLSASGAISITGLTADQNYSDLKIIVPNGTEYDINAQQNTWDTTNWSDKGGGSITGQLGTAWMDYLKGETGTTTIKLILSDGTIKTATATIA